MDSKLSKADLQGIYENQTVVAFKIIGINEKGFIARISEFRAFVSFYHMPFEYENTKVWECLFPLLKGFFFFAKIHAIAEDGEYYLLDAKAHKFKTMDLNNNTCYNGIIVSKRKSHCFVEMGSFYDWRYGSVRGFLPNSKLDRIINRDDLKIGHSISVYVYDKLPDGTYVVQGSISSRDWDNGTALEIHNKKVPAKIISHGGQKFCIVDGKYKGEIKAYQRWYKDTKIQDSIKKNIMKLQYGQVITVQVIKINKRMQTMEVVWIVD